MKTRDVAAKEALGWVVAAWRIFSANPTAWMSIIGVWIGVSLLMFMIPFLNSIGLALLTPIFVGGMMLACRDQLAGKPITAAHLFMALKPNGRALAAIGSLTFLIEMLILSAMIASGVPAPGAIESQQQVLAYLGQLKAHQGTLLLVMVLLLIVKVLLWFTVPLLALHKMPLTHALRWSVFAALSNLGAAFVFVVLMLLAYVPVLITFGMALLVVIPLFVICGYTSYQSVFEVDDGSEKTTKLPSDAGENTSPPKE